MTKGLYRCASAVAGHRRPVVEATTRKSTMANGFYRCAAAVAGHDRPHVEATAARKSTMKALARTSGRLSKMSIGMTAAAILAACLMSSAAVDKAEAAPVKLTSGPPVPDPASPQATAAVPPFAASRMTFATVA